MHSYVLFDRVSKRYQIGRNLPSLRSILTGWRTRQPVAYHWALKDVSFELLPGQALGIIGPNGAGKTTILKTLSRVTLPTSGSVRISGRLAALIELGAGFHPDLTGRENIYLNGVILGMRKSEIKARFDRIVDFAGIGQYLDTPVKRYSSGMYARLGFSIAAHVDPEILMVDEVLSVGDYPFQMKCHARMDELRRNGTSLIFVSHNMEAVRQTCDRGLVMYHGEAIFQGTASEAVVAYSDAIRRAAREKELSVPSEGGLSERVMTFDAEIENVSLLNGQDLPVTVVLSGSRVRLAVDVQFHKDVSNPIFAFTVRTPNGQLIYDTTTDWMGLQTPSFSAGERCRVEYALDLHLLEGTYELGVDIAAADLTHYYDRLERAMVFAVEGSAGAKGLVNLGAEVAFHRPALAGGPS